MNPLPSSPQRSAPGRQASWLQVHLPFLLYGWFWFGMFLCGLLAPDDRVAELGSGLVQQGWHLSVLSCVLGLPVIVLYVLRLRPEPTGPEQEP